MKAVIQFIKGIEETTIPIINITRSTDGSTGTATFTFEDASIFYTIVSPGNHGNFQSIFGSFQVISSNLVNLQVSHETRRQFSQNVDSQEKRVCGSHS